MEIYKEEFTNTFTPAFPQGTILAWYRTEGLKIPDPSEWAVCDGTNGTPDLRGKFVSGVSDLASVGLDQNGASAHSHPGSAALMANNPSHLVDGLNAAGDLSTTLRFHTHLLAISEICHIPPNLRLIYLMRR
jgi:hypothetical protein